MLEIWGDAGDSITKWLWNCGKVLCQGWAAAWAKLGWAIKL